MGSIYSFGIEFIDFFEGGFNGRDNVPDGYNI
jgi:hypothetical protein